MTGTRGETEHARIHSRRIAPSRGTAGRVSRPQISGSGWAAAKAWRRSIKDLYRRIEQDELLQVVFPHFNSAAATPFFVQWFGGSRGYSDDLAGGLLRRHQHRYISPSAAAAWLRLLRESLVARDSDAEPIMRPLARIAKAMIHSPEIDPKDLHRSCAAVQDAVQVQFETLLEEAAKGRTDNVREALENDRITRNSARPRQPHAGLGRDVP